MTLSIEVYNSSALSAVKIVLDDFFATFRARSEPSDLFKQFIFIRAFSWKPLRVDFSIRKLFVDIILCQILHLNKSRTVNTVVTVLLFRLLTIPFGGASDPVSLSD